MSGNHFIAKMWRGEEKLWKAFWLWPIVMGLVIGALIYAASLLLGMDYFAIAESLAYQILLLPYWAFLTVSIWRCGRNSNLFWRWLARFVMVVAMIAVVYDIYATFTSPPTPAAGAENVPGQAESFYSEGNPITLCMEKFNTHYRQNKLDPDAYPKIREEYVLKCVASQTVKELEK